MNLLNYSLPRLGQLLKDQFGAGEYYSRLLFNQIYKEGILDIRQMEPLATSPLKEKLAGTFQQEIPEIKESSAEASRKFLLPLKEGWNTESVLITMKNYSTLCVSSQMGCSRACRFCQTARLGLIRNLTTAEIISQLLAVHKYFNTRPRNIVFMGMGEPLDNFAAVLEAIEIMIEPRGLNIPAKYISLSTCGNVPGIEKLSRHIKENSRLPLHRMHLSVSLNAVNNTLRDELMPVNRKYPLEQLKEALLKSPFSSRKDGLYFEYIIIPEVNNSEKDLKDLLAFTKGMMCKINLIPYTPTKGDDTPWRAPTPEEVSQFHKSIMEAGLSCHTRKSRGEEIMAACGHLGGKC